MSFAIALAVGAGALLVFEGLTAPWVPPGSRLTSTLVLSVASGTIAFALTGWPVAAATGAIGGAVLPAALTRRRLERDRIELTEAIAAAAGGLRDAVRSGLGVPDALADLAVWGPPRLRSALVKFAARARRIGVAGAATEFAHALGVAEADMLAATLRFNERVGGAHLSDVLDVLAEELAAEATTLRELRAHQAHQRVSALVAALAPVVVLVALRHSSPDYLAPYRTALGQVVLGIAAVLIATGYAAMARLSRPPEAVRVALRPHRP